MAGTKPNDFATPGQPVPAGSRRDIVHLKPRWLRRYQRIGGGQQERQTRHDTLDWAIPMRQMALVCLDVWNTDSHQDMHERDDQITRQRIVPVLTACRAAGMRIIHAPAPQIAHRHRNWVGPIDEPAAPPANWPPSEFIHRRGPYAAFACPEDPTKFATWQWLNDADFHDLVRPEGSEPVIATGTELHRLCEAEGILFLLYVGHHTPGCMTGRTYGLVRMRERGYACILLRDCTNGMETHETFEDQTCLKGAIASLENFGEICTLESAELIAALSSH